MKKYLPVLFLLLLAGCQKPKQKSQVATNKFQDQTLRTIYTFQDERNTAQLLPYLKDANPTYREAAASAFGSVQDKTAVPQLAALLEDPEAKVRQAAAYALGQTGDAVAEDLIIAVLNKETNKPARAEMFEALGKVATEKGISMLTTYDTPDPDFQTGQAWGLYRAALRGPLPANALTKAVSFLGKGHAMPVRLAAAQTLARSGKADLSAHFAAIQKAIEQEPEYTVRSAEASALGKVKSPESAKYLQNLAANDPDYRVRLSAIRSLKDQAGDLNGFFRTALEDNNPHVRLTAAEVMIARNQESPEMLQTLARKQTDWRTRALLYGAALKATKDQEMLRTEIISRYRKTDNIYEKGALLNALGNDINSYSFLEKETFEAKNPVISTYGIEALGMIRKNPQFPENLKMAFAELLKKAAASSDVALIGTAATLLREPELNFKQTITDFEFLKTAQANIKLPRDVETYIELQKTIAFFEGKPAPEPPKSPAANPINWDLIQRLPKEQKVLIKTSQGDITFQLYVEEAPGTVANFVSLVEKGFYNDLNFHRVVPNFVAQGGDPRGDGWGGTDYTIRSEFADLHYEEGTVGLASAGKDTESCQWFITHNYVPHLDGRYTIFAKVISGMEALHKLQIGDKILKAELVK